MVKTRVILTLITITLTIATTTAAAGAFFKTTNNNYPVTLSGTGIEHTFNIGGALTVKCQAEFQGNFKLPSGNTEGGSQLTVRPIYNQCTGKLGGGAAVGVTIHTNGCQYNIHQAKGAKEGSGSAECHAGNTIEFEVTGCAIKAGSQTNLRSVTFENEGEPKTISATGTATGIAYTASGCGELIKAGAHNDGEYKGKQKLKVKFKNEPEGIEVV
jgi:hypothetical protein